MRIKTDLLGARFGQLVVVAAAPNMGRNTAWKIRFDCGHEKIMLSMVIKRGVAKCECGKDNATAKPEYRTWLSIKSRHVAGLVKVCDEWLSSFNSFYDHVGCKPTDKHSIDRIDNAKGYEPNNCRWATVVEQSRNKTNNKMIERDGQIKCLAEWAEISGIKYNTVSSRLRYGWSVESALTSPIGPSGPKARQFSTAEAKHPLHRTWKKIKERCLNKNDVNYVYYGGRGIRICDRWRNSFLAFVEDMGERPAGYTLNGDYEKTNCRWASNSEQARNRSDNRYITAFGKTQCLTDWAASIGINQSSLSDRLKSRSPEEVLTMPIKRNAAKGPLF